MTECEGLQKEYQNVTEILLRSYLKFDETTFWVDHQSQFPVTCRKTTSNEANFQHVGHVAQASPRNWLEL